MITSSPVARAQHMAETKRLQTFLDGGPSICSTAGCGAISVFHDRVDASSYVWSPKKIGALVLQIDSRMPLRSHAIDADTQRRD